MTTSKFDPVNAEQYGLRENLNGAALPDIDQLTKLANQLFSAPPCDGSRLSAAANLGQSSLTSPLANLDNIGVGKISPHDGGLPGEAEVRHFLASQKPSFEDIPNHLDVDSGYGKPASSGTVNDFASALAGFDKSALAGIFSHTHGLPSEAELQELLVSRPPNGGRLPENLDSHSVSSIPATGPSHPIPHEVPVHSTQPSQEDISSTALNAEVQALFAKTALATSEFADSPNKAGNFIPDMAAVPNIQGLSIVPTHLDTNLIAGFSPQNYGLPGESELQQLFAAYLTPVSKPTLENNAARSNFYFLDELKSEGFNTQALGSAHPAFDVHAVRRDFPILKERVNGYPLAWFDNAATTQKPQAVIDRVSFFYEHENSNIHRAAHELAARATDAYEKARDTVARFLNAPSSEEIIFVRGTTEAINLIAQSWGRQNIGKDDEIVITWLEHHANIVPWQQLCQVTGAKLRVVPVDDSGQILLGEYQKLLNSHTKLVSFTQVSNALGTVTPAQEMIAMAHRVGARVLLDGAQSVSHLQVDVQALDCDWLVFSGHKIFGPTGIGAVYGKAEVLEAMPPWQGGGNMIEDVTFEKTVYQPAPAKFEAGTGNIADAVGLGAALEYLTKIGIHNVARYEHELLVYGMEALKRIPGLRLIGTAKEKTSVLSFVLAGHSNQDIGVALNQVGIAVRTGHHCAQPILRRFGLESTVRPSIAFYNTYEEVDRLVDVVKKLSNKHQGTPS